MKKGDINRLEELSNPQMIKFRKRNVQVGLKGLGTPGVKRDHCK